MSFVPQDIVARRGDLVLRKWAALLQFIARTGIVAGPGVRVTQTPNGTMVDSDASFRPWSHPFKVSCDGEKAAIRAGLVNGIAPHVDGVRITGVDDGGKEIAVPDLVIEHDGTPITYIALIALTSTTGRNIEIVDSPETLFIGHVTELPENFAGGGTAPDLGRATYPLAALYWSSKGVLRRKIQIVHHNLGHRYIQSQAKAGIPGRHLFWAA